MELRFARWEFFRPLGGRVISYRVLDLLNLKQEDRLCDICCGEAGTLTLVDQPLAEVYGVDISTKALEKASRTLEGRNFHLRQADIREMPFDSCYFDKLFAQDPDVFLYPDKQRSMDEISRVTRTGGRFVLQTYCATSNLQQYERDETDRILRNMGYPYTDVVDIDCLRVLGVQSGFSVVESQDLHEVYFQDNLRMIENLGRNWERIRQDDEEQTHNLRELLYWEKHLFSKKAWSGILLVMEKS